MGDMPDSAEREYNVRVIAVLSKFGVYVEDTPASLPAWLMALVREAYIAGYDACGAEYENELTGERR